MDELILMQEKQDRQNAKRVLMLYGINSLEDATPENWPFWSCEACGPEDCTHPRHARGAHMPKFYHEDSACLELARKMSTLSTLNIQISPSYQAEWFGKKSPHKHSTLAGALLQVLDRIMSLWDMTDRRPR